MNPIARIFARRRLYSDLSEEMRQHLEERAGDFVREGMSREDARMAARREFGNVTALEERGRETWQWPALESVLADLRYGLRQLRKQPSFGLAAAVILGLGIGANATVYSVVDKLLLDPLPFRAPERLVWIINEDTPGLSGRTSQVSTYEALAGMRSLEQITTYEAFFARSTYKLSGAGEPERVSGVLIPADFLPFFGVRPMLGRGFTQQECMVNGPGAVMISYDLWQRRYAADPGVIGRQLAVNDRAATIVGVMPASFDFGGVFAPGLQIEIYMPAVFDVLRKWGNTLAIVGRLRPGVSMGAAQAEANAIIERLQRERPEFGPPRSYHAILKPFHDSVIGSMRRPVLTLWAAVGLVLLIVCVNLSNLLLARAVTRRREMALRGALGAGRGRLARQLLSEGVILSVIGGGFGIAFAYGSVAYIRRLEDLSIPLIRNVTVDAGAIGVTLGLAVFATLLFGLAPAVAVLRPDLAEALKGGGRGSSEDRDHRFARSSLVVAEVALACLLLAGAGLLLRSFLNLLDVDLGFRTERTYSLRIDPARDIIDDRENYQAYLRSVVAAARETGGVEAASITDAVPLESNRSWSVRATGQPPDRSTDALVKIIGPGLLETMRTPLIAGREFTSHDHSGSGPVALVNESLARKLWPGQDPLTKTLHVALKDWQVVGVAADVRHLSVEEGSGSEFYLPVFQMRTSSPALVIRTSRPFPDVGPSLRSALARVAPGLPTSGFRPLTQGVDRALSPRRFLVNLLAAFALCALALAAIGIYGVISYSVTRRTPEIGIRMALGASSGRIRAGVVCDTLRLALPGVILGVVGTLALSSLLGSLLIGVSPGDPVTAAGAAAILLSVAVAAGLVPALRASRISPMSALRAE